MNAASKGAAALSASQATNDDELLALDDLPFLEHAYFAVLGRPADSQGLLGYLSRLSSGASKKAILSELRDSQEGRVQAALAAARDGSLSSVGHRLDTLLSVRDAMQFVELAHRALLGRAATDEERAAGRARLSSGLNRLGYLDGLRRSAEGQQHPTAVEDIYKLDLSADEIANAAACDLASLLSVSNEAFVQLAYMRLLGREPEPAGRQNYTLRVRSGVSRALILQDLRLSPEGQQHGAHLEGLVEAAAQTRSWRHRVCSMLGRGQPVARQQAQGRQAPPSLAMSTPALGTAQPSTQSIAQPSSGLVVSVSKQWRLSEVTASLAQRLRVPSPPHNARAQPVLNTVTTMYPSMPKNETADMPLQESIALEAFVGPLLQGWSVQAGQAAVCAVTFGNRLLGSIRPQLDRVDIQTKHGLASAKVGFEGELGGLLQFSALQPTFEALEMAHVGAPRPSARLALAGQLAEALVFSPLKAFARMPAEQQLGRLLSLDFLEGQQLVILFEAAASAPAGLDSFLIDVYQSSDDSTATLERLARYAITIAGQVLALEVTLLSRQAPVLMVATDNQHNILLTDCIPLPEMHAENQRPLLEYHSLLTGAQPAFDVAAKISRNHLDAAIRRAMRPSSQLQASEGPSLESTAVLLYSRENHDFLGDAEVHAVSHLGMHCGVLHFDGSVVLANGATCTLQDFMDSPGIAHVMLLDMHCTPRPDFWAILEQNRFRLGAATQLVHWHSIWLEGFNRPFIAKPGLLLDPSFVGHETIPLRAALVELQYLKQMFAQAPQTLRSGALRLEQCLAAAGPVNTVCIPIVLDCVTWPTVPPAVAALQRSEHLPLPPHTRTPQAARATGVSVIINYRNSPADTLQCLRSLHTQVLSIPIEIILVNNLSTPTNVDTVTAQARELFGLDAVLALDYPFEFNHSAQCNLAAKVARHELLLMLSNDSVMLAPDALAMACEVAMVDWVATVGFRIIGYQAGKAKLQSLGLGQAPRQMLFHGGSPLATHRPPAFLLPFTQETLGNTFAAVVLRRQSYLALGGLDEEAFPTNYNDVDYCCRAMQQGLRHVCVGSAVVQHVGRGSREMDLDLPIDQRIVERCPDFSRLTGVGVAQL